jgi:hypothetical protein
MIMRWVKLMIEVEEPHCANGKVTSTTIFNIPEKTVWNFVSEVNRMGVEFQENQSNVRSVNLISKLLTRLGLGGA